MSWYRTIATRIREHQTARARVVTLSFFAIGAIALADWLIEPNVALGVLYFLPLLFLAAHLGRKSLIVLCIVCAVLREAFSPYVFNSEVVPRFLFVFASYSGAVLFVNQIFRSRRQALEMLERIRAETEARRESEARLRAIFDSTPVGLLVLSPVGEVLMASHTAETLLALPQPSPESGRVSGIASYIPGLVSFLSGMAPSGDTPLILELPAWRADGRQFLARWWVARSAEERDPVTAVALTDISEQVREAAMAGLEHLIDGSRVVVGAVSHEIRNLAAAIGVEARNIARAGGADAGPLLALSTALETLAATQLQTVHPRFDARTDVTRVLHEIAAIMAPEFHACGAALSIDSPSPELWARAESHGLLQVLLNLLNNAVRHCAAADGEKTCRLAVSRAQDRIAVRVSNPGEPVEHPERLFQPFTAAAEGTGLGLYVSRSILRSFGGDLRYDTRSGAPCFLVELTACPKPSV